MKLFDTKLELQVIKSICDSPSKYSSKLIGGVSEKFFQSEAAVETFNRILKILKKESEPPSFKSLISDPVISETTRSILKKQKESIKNSKDTKKAIKRLFEYKQLRDMYYLSEQINSTLLEDKVDVEELVEKVLKKTSKLKLRQEDRQEIFTYGEHSTSGGILKKLLDKTPPKIVPTGFQDFDEKNGGFAWGSLVGLAGNAGSGKTALALQMAVNIATISREDVVYVPLEMTEDETMERVYANLSGVDIYKIKNKKLTKVEEKKLIKADKRFNRDLAKDGTRFTIYCPYEGITMTEALAQLKPYGFKVTIVDYLGLLDGLSGDAQWQAMGEAAKEAKIYAKNTEGIVILLAQSDDKDHVLRYSKVLQDHANNLWVWIANDETRENRVMNIKQRKARNQAMFDFQLGFDPDIYRVFSMKGEQPDNTESKSKKDYLESMDD